MNTVLKKIIYVGIVTMTTSSCNDSSPNIQHPIVISDLSGYIQKGPYINGTTLSISELNSNLSQTGRSFNTVISDNRGSFEVSSITLNSQFIELMANGFYYNEVESQVSAAPLTLWAISDISGKDSVNVNILTHLERDRVKYLVGNGVAFKKAKDSASNEVLKIFGMTGGINPSESLNISSKGDDNAKLLAISIIIQGTRSVGEVSELLANIITDVKEDGKLDSESIKKDLQTQAVKLSLPQVRKNIESRYTQLGITASIADFETYINQFAEESIYGTLTDFDGNEYRTKKIGGQWWMVDNLKTKHYSNGDALVNGTALVNLFSDDSTRYYFNNPYPPPWNDEVPSFGYYYTFAATMNGANPTNSSPSGVQGACPSGWHIPSFAEFQILNDYMAVQGFNPGYFSLDMPDNGVGFNLVKAGVRGGSEFDYAVVGYNYAFWTTTFTAVGTIGYHTPEDGINVRCIKD